MGQKSHQFSCSAVEVWAGFIVSFGSPEAERNGRVDEDGEALFGMIFL
jgi:hypothetical protein